MRGTGYMPRGTDSHTPIHELPVKIRTEPLPIRLPGANKPYLARPLDILVRSIEKSSTGHWTVTAEMSSDGTKLGNAVSFTIDRNAGASNAGIISTGIWISRIAED